MKKKVNFYFPFSPYEHRKKSSGDYQLTVASLIVVDDAVLKSLSLIDQLWSYESLFIILNLMLLKLNYFLIYIYMVRIEQ